MQFELHQRHLEASVTQVHTVAVAQIEKGCLENSLTETWVLASIPSISETLIIALFREPPHAFIDFIAELDATSQTADHITHGYTSQVQHSILLHRNINSYTLIGFQELWPQLRLQGQKNHSQHPQLHTNNSTSYYSQDEIPSSFQGLVVHFQNEPWIKQLADEKNQHRFKLEALSRSKNSVADIALPPRSANQTPIEHPQEAQVDEHTMPFTPPVYVVSESINQEDIALLRSFKQGPTIRTFLLFSLFLIISSLVFWLS